MLICCPTGGGVVMGVSNACFLAENMVIAAQSIGIGSCYLGGPAAFFNSPEGRVFTEKFGIPEGYTVAYAITFGYPDQSPEAKPRDMSKYKFI